MTRPITLLSVVSVLALLVYCRAPQSPTQPPVALLPAKAPVSGPFADAGSNARAGAVLYALSAPEETALSWLSDRTLIVQTPDWLAARTQTGKTYRVLLAPGDTINLASAKEGIVVSHADRETCALYSTPSLEKVLEGKCALPMRDWGAAVFSLGGKTILAFQKNGTLFKVPVPKADSLIAVDPSDSGKIAVLSDDRAGGGARIVRSDTGAEIGAVAPLYEYGGSLAMGAIVGESLYALHGDVVDQIDLATGKTQGQIRVGCKPAVRSRGSSEPPPVAEFDSSSDPHSLFASTSRLLVVCKNDLLVFGNRTVEGRIPRVLPGCDNMGLPGALSADGKRFTVIGCGGIARIDLATRKYLCADNEGVAGGAYAMVPGIDTRAPLRRGALPRCTKAPEGVQFLDEDEQYWIEIRNDDTRIVRGASASFALEKEAMAAVYVNVPGAPQLAYVSGHEIVGRQLPDGKETFRWDLKIEP
jgi:hypothetical protein